MDVFFPLIGYQQGPRFRHHTLSPGAPEAPEAGVPQTPEEEEELQRYLRCAEDGLDQLGLQVRRHQDLILQLSRDIDLELAAAAAGGPAV